MVPLINKHFGSAPLIIRLAMTVIYLTVFAVIIGVLTLAAHLLTILPSAAPIAIALGVLILVSVLLVSNYFDQRRRNAIYGGNQD